MTKTLPKILLAEDDNDMRRFLVKALENAGYEVTDYDNGMSAYRRLREEPFELLLTDIVMPEMDGIALCQRVAAVRPGLPIVLITGRADMATVTRALRVGVKDFLTKPLDPLKLEAVVASPHAS